EKKPLAASRPFVHRCAWRNFEPLRGGQQQIRVEWMDAHGIGARKSKGVAEYLLFRKCALHRSIVTYPGELLQIIHENGMSVDPAIDRHDLPWGKGCRRVRRNERRGPEVPLSFHEFQKSEARIVE